MMQSQRGLRGFFRGIVRNAAACFSRSNWKWHALAILLTVVLVLSGSDWLYFNFFRTTVVPTLLFPAVVIGGFVPVLVPLGLYITGKVWHESTVLVTAYALGQAAMLGSLISSSYKALTGRVAPQAHHMGVITDMSRVFHFGFWRNGIFWGWPSSHTTIAVAMSVALATLYAHRPTIRVGAYCYALFIAVGVSMSIHWLSDVVAGTIIGTVIGITVGNSFSQRSSAA